jgi:transcription elongation factor GreA
MATQKSGSEVEIMTRSGFEKLKAELAELRSEKRMEVAHKLEEARAFGDLSENAEYHAAKEEQEKIEGRISHLEYKLNRAKVVDFDDIDTSHANLGTTVEFEDLDNSRKSGSYTLVGTDESSPNENKISVSSPVGKALIGRSVGDEVSVRTPKRVRRLKILGISAQH